MFIPKDLMGLLILFLFWFVKWNRGDGYKTGHAEGFQAGQLAAKEDRSQFDAYMESKRSAKAVDLEPLIQKFSDKDVSSL